MARGARLSFTPHAALPAAAAAAAAAPGLALLTPSTIFSATSALMVPIYGLMIMAPRAGLTEAIVASRLLPLTLCGLYAFLMFQLAGAGLFDQIRTLLAAPTAAAAAAGALWPAADGATAIAFFCRLFQSPAFTCMAWVHLLLLDFYQARHVYLDGVKNGIFTAHSLALCFMFGPLGVLCHMATRGLQAAAHSMLSRK